MMGLRGFSLYLFCLWLWCKNFLESFFSYLLQSLPLTSPFSFFLFLFSFLSLPAPLWLLVKTQKWEEVSLCSSDWPEVYGIVQAGLKLEILLLGLWEQRHLSRSSSGTPMTQHRYFSHCCDEPPKESSLRKEMCIRSKALIAVSPCGRVMWVPTLPLQSGTERGECYHCSDPFPVLFNPEPQPKEWCCPLHLSFSGNSLREAPKSVFPWWSQILWNWQRRLIITMDWCLTK